MCKRPPSAPLASLQELSFNLALYRSNGKNFAGVPDESRSHREQHAQGPAASLRLLRELVPDRQIDLTVESIERRAAAA